jgi:hypothetical protein
VCIFFGKPHERQDTTWLSLQSKDESYELPMGAPRSRGAWSCPDARTRLLGVFVLDWVQRGVGAPPTLPPAISWSNRPWIWRDLVPYSGVASHVRATSR